MKFYQQLSILQLEQEVVVDFKTSLWSPFASRIYRWKSKEILSNEKLYNKIKFYDVIGIEASGKVLYITLTD